MKFGRELQTEAQEEFKYYYCTSQKGPMAWLTREKVDYDKLKRLIKDGVARGRYVEDDESQFIDTLERELEKVTAFHELKKDELNRRLASAETLLEKAESSTNTIGIAEEGTSKISSDVAKQIADELNGCSQTISKLSRFTKLNYTGFMKILKKHDKHTNFQLKSMFLMRMNNRPWYKDNLDDEIVALSDCYNRFNALSGQSPEKPLTRVGSLTQGDRVGRTIKFWVHPDNVTELKILLLKHLPVLYFGNRGGREGDASASYVYFDNESFDMYMDKLEETPGSENIRFRWFGQASDQPTILIERKSNSPNDSSPQDSQFLLKEKYINDYVNGRFTMAPKFQKMSERQGVPEKDIDALETLANSIQQTILDKQLKPVLRVYYNRTAFKIPGDESISVSIDTEIAMIREDNYDRIRSGENWRRSDINKETYPFKSLSRDECHLFPFAVMEIKLSLPVGGEAPYWVQEVIGSGLLEPVQKFSKFVHGVGTLLDNRVSILPYWLVCLFRRLTIQSHSWTRIFVGPTFKCPNNRDYWKRMLVTLVRLQRRMKFQTYQQKIEKWWRMKVLKKTNPCCETVLQMKKHRIIEDVNHCCKMQVSSCPMPVVFLDHLFVDINVSPSPCVWNPRCFSPTSEPCWPG
jgi:SPX domain protein involved in polyphosphate accumulation